MKIAICLMGIVGGAKDNAGKAGQGQASLDPRISHESFKKQIIKANPGAEIDVFIHTWSVDHEDTLTKLYNPKVILAEEQDPFDKGELYGFGIMPRDQTDMEYTETYRFRHYSNWCSKYRSIKLKHDYEKENNMKYDAVLLGRLDMWYGKPIKFKKFDLRKVHVFNWHKDLGHCDHPQENRSVDVTFFGNSDIMNGFVTHFKNIKEYAREPLSPNLKDPVDGHSIAYNYVRDFAGANGVKHVFFEFEDWALIRKIPTYSHRICDERIIQDYGKTLKKLKLTDGDLEKFLKKQQESKE